MLFYADFMSVYDFMISNSVVFFEPRKLLSLTDISFQIEHVNNAYFWLF